MKILSFSEMFALLSPRLKASLLSFICIVFVFALYYSIPQKTKKYFSITSFHSYENIDRSNARNLVYFMPYTFKKSDNIWDVARRFGVNVDTIIAVNFPTSASPSDFYRIKAGKVIYIPNVNGVSEIATETNLHDVAKIYNLDENLLEVFNETPYENFSSKKIFFIPWRQMSPAKLAKTLGQLFFSPLKEVVRISSGFGMRIDPITKKREFHTGIDLPSPEGTPVYSALGGVVTFAGPSSGYGNLVIISHKDNLSSYYAHLSKISVRSGSRVGAQIPIGTAGNTGRSTGSHLHYEIRRNNIPMDPRGLTSLNLKSKF